LKWVRSLDRKKVRDEEQVFVVEGRKGVDDFVASGFELVRLWEGEDACRLSLQKAPQGVLAVFRRPEWRESVAEAALQGIAVVLDGVQDPGNVGTIVRLCDWFGVESVFCLPGTADVWGPKAVQASMGSLSRVRVVAAEAADLAGLAVPVYGTFLDGEPIYNADLQANGVVVMGNEGNGISDAVAAVVSRRLTIPSLAKGPMVPDSLNVAMATGIVLSEFGRRALSRG